MASEGSTPWKWNKGVAGTAESSHWDPQAGSRKHTGKGNLLKLQILPPVTPLQSRSHLPILNPAPRDTSSIKVTPPNPFLTVPAT